MFGIYPIIPQYFGIMGISAFKLMCLGIVLFACIFLGISRTLVTSCWHIQIAFGILLIIMFINSILSRSIIEYVYERARQYYHNQAKKADEIGEAIERQLQKDRLEIKYNPKDYFNPKKKKKMIDLNTLGE